MELSIDARAPFDLRQSLAFLRSFPPCRGDHVLTADSVTAAVTIGGRAVAFELRQRANGGLTVEVPDTLGPTARARAAQLAAWFVSADDDLRGFYAAAGGDHPSFAAIVRALHGLHQVRFLTLADITVYAVLMQRTPIGQAAASRRRFLDRFGHAVEVDGSILRAMPELRELTALEAADYRTAIGNPRKADVLPAVVRGVAALGEEFLRTASYADARDALLAIPNIGPFSAAAILLRGLGRMDDVPIDLAGFAEPAREVYGAAYDPGAITRRYGTNLGYWAYYLKTGVPRLPARRARARAAN